MVDTSWHWFGSKGNPKLTYFQRRKPVGIFSELLVQSASGASVYDSGQITDPV
jgi:hypothetical protein